MLRPGPIRAFRAELKRIELLDEAGQAQARAPGVDDYLDFHASRYALTTQAIVGELRGGESVLEIGPSPWLATQVQAAREVTWEGVRGSYRLDGQRAQRARETLCTRVEGRTFRWGVEAGVNVEVDPLPYEDGRFDLVLFLEVVEHLIRDPVHALREISRVLKPEGVLLMSTDNASSFVKLLKLLGHQAIYFPLARESFGERHNREYLPHELRDLMEGIGYRDVSVQTFNHLPFLPGDHLKKSIAYQVGNLLTRLPVLRRYQRHCLVRAKRGAARDYRPAWLFLG